MDVPVTVAPRVAPRVEPPHCYGNPQLWDRNHPMCAGGADANYIDTVTQKHVRPQCDFFHSCGTRAAAARVIPISNIVRPPVVTPPPSAAPQPSYQPYIPPTSTADYMRRVEAERRAAIGQPPVPHPPQQTQLPSQWAFSYAVPPFLSAQEQRLSGESWWAPLLRQLLRGIGKALGHVAAHWFDTHVMRAAPPEKKE
jgi:hypothetical protein